ncbi:TrmB family transcriptional regulator [Nanoarchaeota archaeon]
MDIKKTLKNIGLSNNEINAYLALIKVGPSKAGRIAKEASIDRSACYDALKRLLEKGLISYVTKANVKWFQPENPSRIKEYLKDQMDDVDDVMPQLVGLYKLPKESKNVRIFHGYKGIRSVFQDIATDKTPVDVFGSEGQFVERMPYYAPHFINAQVGNKIKTRLISRKGRGEDNAPPNTEVRHVPKDVISPVATNIYGDKIAIIIWSEPPEAIIIENRDAAQSYRAYFEVIWKSAQKFTKK